MKTYAIALLISSSAAVKVKTHTAAKSAQPTSVNMTQDQKDNCDLTSSLDGDWTRFDLICPKFEMNEPAYDPSNPGLPPTPFGERQRDENGCYNETSSSWHEDHQGNLIPYHDMVDRHTFCDVGDKFETHVQSSVYNWPQSLEPQNQIDKLRDPLNLVVTCTNNYDESTKIPGSKVQETCSDKAGYTSVNWRQGEEEYGTSLHTKTLYTDTAGPKYIHSTYLNFDNRIKYEWKMKKDEEEKKNANEVDCRYTTKDPMFSKKVECDFKSTGKPAFSATQTASYLGNLETTYKASVDFTEYHQYQPVPANME